MFPLEKWVDFSRLGKLGILLVADAGADGFPSASLRWDQQWDQQCQEMLFCSGMCL